MTVQDLMAIFEERTPERWALEWDNVGLLVGDRRQEVHKVYLTLDATQQAVEEAAASGADFIVTHHPILFAGVKRVTTEDYPGNKVMTLIKKGISCYAMHTNFDMGVMGRLADERMGFTDTDVLDVCGEDASGAPLGIGTVASLSEGLCLERMAQRVKHAFGLERVRVFGDLEREIRVAAMVPGSGRSEIPAALAKGAQVLITGDMDHHSGIDAAAQGLAIIDAGHYGLEHIFLEDMASFIRERADGVEVIRAPFCQPFCDI